jgi:DNA-binding CsgD family transcriptional regulator
VGGGVGRTRAAPSLDWPFARHCARAEDLGDLRDLLQVEIERLGFRYFCCCSHVRPDRPVQGAVFLHNYPKPWVEHYNRAKLFERDPIFVIGRNFPLPFLWSDPRFVAMLEPDQAAIMVDAARYGLQHGATIPLHGPGRYSASCSLISDNAEIDPDKLLAVQRYAAFAYEAARALVGPTDGRPRIVLPRRERECIKLVALGKDDETIAMILGIQRDTVRTYIEEAKQKLGVTKRSHAVAYAIYAQAINLEDLFGE